MGKSLRFVCWRPVVSGMLLQYTRSHPRFPQSVLEIGSLFFWNFSRGHCWNLSVKVRPRDCCGLVLCRTKTALASGSQGLQIVLWIILPSELIQHLVHRLTLLHRCLNRTRQVLQWCNGPRLAEPRVAAALPVHRLGVWIHVKDLSECLHELFSEVFGDHTARTD